MDLLDFIHDKVEKWESPGFDPKGFSYIEFSTNIKPKDYIRFAEEDLKISLEHSYINAMSNAKRAIDCQVDNLIAGFGLKKRRNFPQKAEDVQNLGLVAPRILRKVMKIRNRMEHEYYKPTRDESEDAIDIAVLFVEATSAPFRELMTSFFVCNEYSNVDLSSEEIAQQILTKNFGERGYTFHESFYVDYDLEEKTFYIDCVTGNSCIFEIEINSENPCYIEFIKFVIESNVQNLEFSGKELSSSFVNWIRKRADIF